MPQKVLIFGILCLVFVFTFSCSSKQKTAKKEEIEEVVPEEEPEELIEKINVIHKIEILQNFSDELHKDRFYLTLEGDSILKGRVNFEIYSYQNELIYSEVFPATDFIDEGLIAQNPNPGTAEKSNYIRRRMNEFFDKKNFQTPAIKSTEEFDAKRSEKPYWDETQLNLKSIGFTYKVQGEQVKKIAYSIKNKKAVLFFKCC